MVAIPVAPLLHEPPEAGLLSVVAEPSHITIVPVIAPIVFTVKVKATLQPALNV
jgi:hypothetical protein